jgi:hypothetical protein
MNLIALRDRIKNLTDYSPQLQPFDDQLDSLINEAYMSIWRAKRWNFAQKIERFYFHPDIKAGRDAVTLTASVEKGSRYVNLSTSLARLEDKGTWEGTIFECDGIEYIISKIVSGDEFILTTQFLGDTNPTAPFVIKKRWYPLPYDTIELLSLSHRDAPIIGSSSGGAYPQGKILGLSNRRDETLSLREDYTASWAEVYIPGEYDNIPPGELLEWETTQREILPDDGFKEGSSIEVCWAFERNGKIGPLSQPYIITMPVNVQETVTYSITLKFLSWDEQAIVNAGYQSKDVRESQWEGYRKVIFWNANFDRTRGERKGLPCWKFFNQSGATRNLTQWLEPIICSDESATVSIPYFSCIDPGNKRYLEVDGQHLIIRPYPRVDSWDKAIPTAPGTEELSTVLQKYLKIGEMRYYYKPPLLTQGTDSPPMPYEFHGMIVDLVLSWVYLKLGNMSMSGLYEAKGIKNMKNLEKRYVDRVDTHVARQSFSMGWGSAFWDNNSLKHTN